MAKKTSAIKPDRLETIESRLHQVEDLLSQILLVSASRLVGHPFRHPLSIDLLALTAKGIPKKAAASLKEERRQLRETPVEPWKYLVRRQHPWRKQLYITGRNMTARQLVGSIKANGFDQEKAAADFHLPVEAVQEALAYVEANKELLETEAEIERLMSRRGGIARGPQSLQ